MLFDVQVYERSGWTVIAVVGELDLPAAPRIRQAIVAALGAARYADAVPRVVLDLGAVHFLDSCGLGIVLGALRRARGAGGVLRVVASEPQVLDLIRLVQLDTIIEVLETVASAIEAPSSSPPAGVATIAGRHDG